MHEPLYLGIDPSLVATGLCTLTPAGVSYAYTVNPAPRRGIARISYIRDYINDMVEPDGHYVACMEGYAYGTRGNLFDKGELGGAIKLAFLDMHAVNVTLLVVAPTSLKMYATGNGAAKKPVVMKAINAHLGTNITDDNQADAAVLACMAKSWWTGDYWGERQAEALTKKVFPCFPPGVQKRSSHPVRRRKR